MLIIDVAVICISTVSFILHGVEEFILILLDMFDSNGLI